MTGELAAGKRNAITGDGQGIWGEDEVELEAEVVVVAVSITESRIPEMDGCRSRGGEGKGRLKKVGRTGDDVGERRGLFLLLFCRF